MNSSVSLSISIPAYNRPKWLVRTLESITSCSQFAINDIEIIISDDSPDRACAEIVEMTLKNWTGRWKYFHNTPALGMANNWNRCLQLSSGQYILVIHDDDFLVDKGVENILETIKNIKENKNVLLFGVNVVDSNGRIMKKQCFRKKVYLEPKEAIQKLTSNSSFVRFPGIVVNKDCFKDVGYFRSDVGGVADLEMWIRLLSQYGLLCIPLETSAYTVHSSALTMDMFNKSVIEQLLERFSQVEKLNLLNQKELEKCKASFLNQFILAGTFRQIRRYNLDKATQIMDLFKIPQIKKMQNSLKWTSLRLLFKFFLLFFNFLKTKE
jgi:glycosyltransferase involved in cell wall biosynthesis